MVINFEGRQGDHFKTLNLKTPDKHIPSFSSIMTVLIPVEMQREVFASLRRFDLGKSAIVVGRAGFLQDGRPFYRDGSLTTWNTNGNFDAMMQKEEDGVKRLGAKDMPLFASQRVIADAKGLDRITMRGRDNKHVRAYPTFDDQGNLTGLRVALSHGRSRNAIAEEQIPLVDGQPIVVGGQIPGETAPIAVNQDTEAAYYLLGHQNPRHTQVTMVNVADLPTVSTVLVKRGNLLMIEQIGKAQFTVLKAAKSKSRA